ncbi:MAG: peptidase S41, partial [Campylobacterota bacterium]|nr:peptidase S41 [Campylobacterota bacterium]
MKNKRYITMGFASITIALSILFSANLFAASSDDKEKETSRLQALAKFTKVISIVERYNVDDITIEDLMDKALKGMMNNLDAHS